MYPMVHGARLELVAREACRVDGVGEVQVDGPRRCERRVLVAHVLVDVVLREHIVAEQAARLAFAQHVGHPREASLCVVGTVRGTVFKETPVGIDHEQPVVAYALGLGYLVAVHARLPRPFAHGNLFGVVFVELNAIRKLGEAALAVSLLAIPLY